MESDLSNNSRNLVGKSNVNRMRLGRGTKFSFHLLSYFENDWNKTKVKENDLKGIDKT